MILSSSAKADEVEHYVDLLEARDRVTGWTTSANVKDQAPARPGRGGAGEGGNPRSCDGGRLDLGCRSREARRDCDRRRDQRRLLPERADRRRRRGARIRRRVARAAGALGPTAPRPCAAPRSSPPSARPAASRPCARADRRGVDFFRLNFSHGSAPEHAENVSRIREVSSELGVEIGILGDLPGPKLRLGDPRETSRCCTRSTAVLYGQDGGGPPGSAERLPVQWEGIANAVRENDPIFPPTAGCGCGSSVSRAARSALRSRPAARSAPTRA